MILMSVGPDIEKMWACLKANMNLMMSNSSTALSGLLVERTSGATVEAGLGVNLHVNGSYAVPHQ